MSRYINRIVMDLVPQLWIKNERMGDSRRHISIAAPWTGLREWMSQESGIIDLTLYPPICFPPLWEAEMKKSGNRLARLQQTGCALLRPERVRANLLLEHPEIFDARDAIQGKYEMLRRHLLEKRAIAAACRDFGFSRESFLWFNDDCERTGLPGYCPKRGRKGP